MMVNTIRCSDGSLFNGFTLHETPIKAGDYLIGVKYGETHPSTLRIVSFHIADTEAGLGTAILAMPAGNVSNAIRKQVNKELNKDELRALIRAKMVAFNEEAIWNIVASRKVEVAKLVEQYNKLK